MKRRIAVRAIAFQSGKLLCVRLKPYVGALPASANDWWCLPGGGLDEGEGLVDGLIREIQEETGVAPKVGGLLYIQQFATPETDAEHLEFFFHIANADDYLRVDLSKSTHGQIEIAEIAFVDPATTDILPKFLRAEDIAAKIAAADAPAIFNRLY
ncbi:MAG TPA: NUDIX hydrolase [Candidatus Saccharimonadales bacterium]|nr:NUDIX hydrolase [Candidatus Saccharimonadales bacterium]